MQRRQRKSKGFRKPRNRGQRSGGLRPPTFSATILANHKFRFSSGGGGAGKYNITRGMLLNLMSVCQLAAGSNQARIFGAVRLKRVDVWGEPSALAGTPTTCSVEWVGLNAPSIIISDTSMGVLPCCVSASPPANSSNRWWCISGQGESEVLFEVEVPAGGIIDVSLAIRLFDDEAATAAESGVAATLGTVYYNYLDGFASAKLLPVDVRVLV